MNLVFLNLLVSIDARPNPSLNRNLNPNGILKMHSPAGLGQRAHHTFTGQMLQSMRKRRRILKPSSSAIATLPYYANLVQDTKGKVVDAAATEGGHQVDITFDDGARYRFHALWLRDACRGEKSVDSISGERYLDATPIGPYSSVYTNSIHANEVGVVEGNLIVHWTENDSVKATVMRGDVLRSYADIVAQPMEAVEQAEETVSTSSLNWLLPYTGFSDAKAPRQDTIRPWNSQTANFKLYDHDEVLKDSTINLDLMESLMRDGVVIVENAPEATSGSVLLDFVYASLGGMQKDPTREEPNWMIEKRENPSSVSYDHDKGLCLHTDQSIPPHGYSGLVLSMHYINGTGVNTLVDGFAVAEELKRTDPEAFRMLSSYDYDAARDFVSSRVDSSQNHTKRLLVTRKNRILQLDSEGQLHKIMYHEVFRMPLELPYDIFPKYYAALDKFAYMLHSDKFCVNQPMEKGKILLMHNWRVLHGRKGGSASPSRKVCGGTITRESFYSKALELVDRIHEQN
eukprot:CAMPEP_0184492104 /NCGR_PEP_ID=MMETSP0113_2-20130426/22309_1 /TAXON_ID=91329 /ORGANISM="Norrisiella sphaerica, Strain BC52" /LENGTH=513 /DNA_ID=CAMNT_0026876755 /DNA_START=96 /DNA_END=1637 /DNA_ORIENTATION=-